MGLREYQRKRDFRQTREPRGKTAQRKTGRRFVVQKHAASRLHYDFRLELDGVLKSWAVPKGPSLDPAVKSLAVEVEDHPLDYASFEGTIPQGQYGGGTVMVWDQGEWDPPEHAAADLRAGHLKFHLRGDKLRGEWALIRMKDKQPSDNGHNWLLIKKDDDAARPIKEFDVTRERPESIVTGRSLDEIAAAENGKTNPATKSRKPAARQSSARKSSRRKSAARSAKSPTPDPSTLPGACPAKLPATFAPQLATLSSSIPEGDDWLHEVKFDGYRLLAVLQKGKVKLLTRRGNDWTSRFSQLAAALKQLPTENTILDGELVVLDDSGVSRFQSLQNSLDAGLQDELVFYVFDVPYFQGYDLRSVPLIERKHLLHDWLVAGNPHNIGTVRYSDHVVGDGPRMLEQSCRHQLEGVISKRIDSHYAGRRTRDWLKSKCHGRQEFVIGGYTQPAGSRTGFGALLLGYYRDDRLHYCGRVGTGFTQKTLKDLLGRMKPLSRKSPAFAAPPTGAAARGVTWIDPELVAEVEFTEWTSDGILRHPSFQGLREDKAAQDVVREGVRATDRGGRMSKKIARVKSVRSTLPPAPSLNREGGKSVAASARQDEPAAVAGVTISHPDRVIFPDAGLTKLDLARYYEAVADWVLPHIVNRPLTLVRCPGGRQAKCFYQKHWTESLGAGVESVLVKEKNEEEPYVFIRDLTGLISLVQMNALEFHPWPARNDRLDRPDRVVLDLDPGEGVKWPAVLDGAREIKSLLEDAGLQSFVRTSGGKGLHVVFPIDRRHEWDAVEAFSRQVATTLAEQSPQKYVINMRKDLRKGKIFIDFHRNRRGATAIASYSSRARSGAPVATPLTWDELDDVQSSDQWTIATVPQRLRDLATDPWEGFDTLRQRLPKSPR